MHITEYIKEKVLKSLDLFIYDAGDDIGTRTIFAKDLAKELYGLLPEDIIAKTIDIMGTESVDKLDSTSKILVGTEDGNKAIELSDGIFTLLDVGIPVGMRKNIFRGKNLGDHVTAEQYAEIAAGTFRGMFIGDYWLINDIHWRIADINYWLGTGDQECVTPHLVIVPDEPLYMAQIKNTVSGQYESGAVNTTGGGYISSDMNHINEIQARNMIKSIFGESHILSHREHFVNAITNGKPSSGAWNNSTVNLMNEPMVYGSYVFVPASNGMETPHRVTNSITQLALFALSPDLICNRVNWWLRDVVSVSSYAFVSKSGYADHAYVTFPFGVRQSFGLIG